MDGKDTQNIVQSQITLRETIGISTLDAMEIDENPDMVHTKYNTVITGDAEGADSMWIEQANRQGHHVLILLPNCRWECRYDKTKYQVEYIGQNNNFYAELENLARNIVRRPRVLDQDFNFIDYMYRDIAQAALASSCYAIAKTNFGGPQWPIVGGTAWSTSYFWYYIDKTKLFIYCLDLKKWITVVQDEKNRFQYREVQPPRPSGNYAGVGTRDVSDHEAREIIRRLY